MLNNNIKAIYSFIFIKKFYKFKIKIYIIQIKIIGLYKNEKKPIFLCNFFNNLFIDLKYI